MCAADRNCKKDHKTLIFGNSRSFKVIDVDKYKSPLPVLVMISSMSVPICNRFHTRPTNSGKITSFKGYFFLTPSFKGNPFTQEQQILSQETRVLGAAHSKHFVILAYTVLIQIKCRKHSAVARKKRKMVPFMKYRVHRL